jgi:hypothetical protein
MANDSLVIMFIFPVQLAEIHHRSPRSFLNVRAGTMASLSRHFAHSQLFPIACRPIGFTNVGGICGLYRLGNTFGIFFGKVERNIYSCGW